MDGPHDWDLLAIVRSCTTTTAKPTVSSPSPPPPPPAVQQPPLTSSPSSVLFGFSNPLTTTTTTTSFSTGLYHQELRDIFDNNNPLVCSTSTSTSTSSAFTVSQIVKASSVSQSQRSTNKKRKKLMKKVCHVSNEGLSSDMWAWRKYGQKPIKGSPYPRGYYKCSSSKGCLARKQVERNRSDPKMFIITYTADHNHAMPTHRSTLAGSTRHKPLKSTDTPPASPSPTLASSVSPLTEKSESKTEGHADLMLNDDFYAGFEQLDDVIDDTDCFSELFSTTSEFPWIDSDTVTATPSTAATTISAVGGV